MVGIGELVSMAYAPVPRGCAHVFFRHFARMASEKSRILRGILQPPVSQTSYFTWYFIASSAQNLVFYVVFYSLRCAKPRILHMILCFFGNFLPPRCWDVPLTSRVVARSYFTPFLHVRAFKNLVFYMVFHSLWCPKPRILHGILQPLLLKTSYFTWYFIASLSKTSYFSVYSIASCVKNLVFYIVFHSLWCSKPRILHRISQPLLLKTSYFTWYFIASLLKTSYFSVYSITSCV